MESWSEISLPFEINGYMLLDIIGGGSFSVVYYGIKIDAHEAVAIKTIDKTVVEKKNGTASLQREVDAMAYLKHDSIISLHDFFSDNERFYLVLDYCEGGDLYQVIREAKKTRETQIAAVFQQVVMAVGYCHQRGVAHRDLKPQNILVTQFPNIKVSDFGLCGFISDEAKMKTFCGSPFYAAPECLKQVQYDGTKSDIWSLGVILFELATGEHPWHSGNMPKMIKQICKAKFIVPHGINPALEDLIKSLLRVRPTDRPTCEKILAHPWLKLAPCSRSKSERTVLPPLQPKQISTITRTLDRSSKKPENGVFSPFIEGQITEAHSNDCLRKKRCVTRSHSGSSLGQVAALHLCEQNFTRSPLMNKKKSKLLVM